MNTSQTKTTIAPGASLWASACIIMALIIVAAGRMPGGAAYAEMVAQVGAYTVLTADGGNEEVLLVLDNHNEQVFVYKVVNQKSVQLYQKLDLKRLFKDARTVAQGRP